MGLGLFGQTRELGQATRELCRGPLLRYGLRAQSFLLAGDAADVPLTRAELEQAKVHLTTTEWIADLPIDPTERSGFQREWAEAKELGLLPLEPIETALEDGDLVGLGRSDEELLDEAEQELLATLQEVLGTSPE